MVSAAKRAPSKAAASIASLRFLVVDDHKFSRYITIEALKWLDATDIDEAHDASEAIALLQGTAPMDPDSFASNMLTKRLERRVDRGLLKSKVDCVITDFNMSPLNGLHLLKAIRAGDAKCPRDLPVLMLTGFSDDYLIASALNLDVNAFVLKPISRAAFSEKLARVLRRPVKPQSVELYRAVEIPECADLDRPPVDGNDGIPSVTSTLISDDDLIILDEFAGRPVEHVRLADLANAAAGRTLASVQELVLGEDISGPTGNVLIHRGTRLTDVLLEKLIELNEIGMMPEMIKIIR
jgi:two-component system, chemotaxis family, chemotaxis protein CheY